MPAARISCGSRAGQRQHDIHVVDHQVQNHVHIQAARAEDVEPVDLEEQGQGGAALQLDHRRIEALQVAHLQDAAVAFGGLHQAAGGFQIGAMGFSTSTSMPAASSAAADLLVRGGGHGHDGGIHFAGQFAVIG